MPWCTLLFSLTFVLLSVYVGAGVEGVGSACLLLWEPLLMLSPLISLSVHMFTLVCTYAFIKMF